MINIIEIHHNLFPSDRLTSSSLLIITMLVIIKDIIFLLLKAS